MLKMPLAARIFLSVLILGLTYIGHVEYLYITAEPSKYAQLICDSLDNHPEDWKLALEAPNWRLSPNNTLTNEKLKLKLFYSYNESPFGIVKISDTHNNDCPVRYLFTFSDLSYISQSMSQLMHDRIESITAIDKSKDRLDALINSK